MCYCKTECKQWHLIDEETIEDWHNMPDNIKKKTLFCYIIFEKWFSYPKLRWGVCYCKTECKQWHLIDEETIEDWHNMPDNLKKTLFCYTIQLKS